MAHCGAGSEEYLEAIYQLEELGQEATVTALSKWLGVTKPSVSGMMQRLAEVGLVEYEPYRPLSLTELGETQALQLLRRERLWEVLLYRHLTVPLEAVFDEACCLEHGTSALVEENLAAFLGHPSICPHGFPIPGEQGEVDELALSRLTDLAAGQTGTVRRVPERPQELLAHLKQVGIKPGQRLKTLAGQVDAEAIVVEVDGRKVRLDPDVAANLLVETRQEL